MEGLKALRASWYYTWQAHGGKQSAEGIERVPQIFPHKSEPIKNACERLNFACKVLPEQERLDWAHRYCWYAPHKTGDPRAGSSCLLDDEGKPTALGRYFAEV